jgi:DNA-binding SARP family transcriptional activator
MGEDRGGSAHGQRPASWRLRLVGIVEVSATTGSWETPPVGSRKARTLLALLGAHCGRMVAVDRVIDALWDGAAPRRPEDNVATLVSRLRARFGPEMIIGGRAGYRLGTATQVDLYDAAAQVGKAETWLGDGQPALGLLAAERAMRLLDGGPVLIDHPAAEWAEQARALQNTLLRRAWHVAAECALRTGAPERAQLLAETAIAADSLDEAGYRLLMRACVAAGEPARAILTYERLRATLATELGADPAPATRDLHLAILRANAVAR